MKKKKIDNRKLNNKIINLVRRSKIITRIRSFFSDLNILEIETPILSQFKTNDIFLESFKTYFRTVKKSNNVLLKLWLITSPEYYMKRLIASNIGSIYQICHSFRNNEIGRNHHPEFTILEWYRPLYDMYKLIDEVELFLKIILNVSIVEKFSYRSLFIKYLHIDPLLANDLELIEKTRELGVENLILRNKHGKVNINSLFEVLFVFGVEPFIGHKYPTIVYHYPSSQAGNATLNIENSKLANRFEIFFCGLEIGNGCNELTNYEAQKNRLETNNLERLDIGLKIDPIDSLFLKSLLQDIPDYSGVAIGVDRLIMILLNQKNIQDVLAFPLHNF